MTTAAPRLRELEQPAPALERQGGARRVLERGDRVDDLRACGPPGATRSASDVDLHPVAVDRDLEQVGLVGQRGRAAVGVGRRLDHDQVAGVDEQLAGQVEPLHAARGDREPRPAWSRRSCRRAPPPAPRAAAGRPRWRRSRTRRGRPRRSRRRRSRRAILRRDRLRRGRCPSRTARCRGSGREQRGARVDHRADQLVGPGGEGEDRAGCMVTFRRGESCHSLTVSPPGTWSAAPRRSR